MIAWLTDTLIMTGAIMALILLVRGPVGRWFGPGAAYALWALPMIRLFLPPLMLPRTIVATPAAEALVPQVGPAVQAVHADMLVAAPLTESAAEPFFGIPFQTVLVAVWLGGAVLFLAHRAIAYRIMRRKLLGDARTIGRAGQVRIIESRAVEAPVAFGVLDRIVALPAGFLASADSDVSDFAITHELEHHAGNDLVANIMVQPLFALHWFNPLAWLAWRALRSDQEAACDSRVMAGRSRQERERYGRLILSFAAGPRFALAAPMAGPLKGDKPIIHRLKALVRNDVPERHRLVGRSLFAACVIAVPLTASVTYAAEELPEAAAPPSAANAGVAQEAPLAAEARSAPQDLNQDVDTGDDTDVAPDQEDVGEVSREVRTVTFAPERPASAAWADRSAELAQANADRAQRRAALASAEADRARLHAERALQLSREAIARAPRLEQTVSSDGKVQTLRLISGHGSGTRMIRTTVLDSTCAADRQPVRAHALSGGGEAETRVCTRAPNSRRHVAVALAQARAAIASNTAISAELREEIVSSLDDEIADAQAETD